MKGKNRKNFWSYFIIALYSIRFSIACVLGRHIHVNMSGNKEIEFHARADVNYIIPFTIVDFIICIILAIFVYLIIYNIEIHLNILKKNRIGINRNNATPLA